MVWALARSLATTYAIIIIFSSYGYLDVSVPHVRSSFDVIGLPPIGFPHSDIPASRVICTSTGLFAAYHVLRRLREPRHPPSALLLLFIFNWSFITERTIRFIYRLFFSIFTLISFSLLCIEAILSKISSWGYFSPYYFNTKSSLCFVHQCQRSHSYQFPNIGSDNHVENNGFEPLTPCLQSRCSSQLS